MDWSLDKHLDSFLLGNFEMFIHFDTLGKSDKVGVISTRFYIYVRVKKDLNSMKNERNILFVY